MARSEDFFEKFIDDTGWHCTLWDYRRSVQSTESKVSFAVQFTRYEEDNSAIGVYASLSIVAHLDGRWDVQARSSDAP